MIFRGKYLTSQDVSRPYIAIEVKSATDSWIVLPFLVDTGADATFLDHSCLQQLSIDLPGTTMQTEVTGVGGNTPFIEFSTQLRFRSETQENKIFVGTIGIFTDPGACDTPVLGRDVLDAFKTIVDRERDQILLLSPPHDYRVVTR